MRRFLLAIGSLLLLALLGFFTLVAPAVDRRMNRVTPVALPEPDSAMRRAHRSLRIVDLHADPLLWPRDLTKRGSHGHVDIPRLIEGNVAIQVFSVVTKTPPGQNYQRNSAEGDNITMLAMGSRWPMRTWGDLLQRALYQSEKLRRQAGRSAGRLVLIENSAQLEQYLLLRESRSDVTAAILAMEGLQALEGNLARLDTLYDAGFRVMGFTHFFDNDLGGSSAGEAKGGLTDFGRQVLARMEEKGILVDLAHASEPLLFEILDAATRPVIVSHTGVQGVCPGPRNLSDEAVKRIAEQGGLIGIGYWDAAVCDISPAGIAKSIRYVADLVGVDHVALGSDFDGATTTGFDTSELVHLTTALLQAGFAIHEVRMIMGENALRVMREVGLGR